MENFTTKLDANNLNVSVTTNSDALPDGSNKLFVTIYHADNPKRWRKIEVVENSPNDFSFSVVKSRLKKRPIVKIRSNYIVDDTNLKKQIAKVTTIAYAFDDTTNDKDYTSKYQDDDTEYDLGKDDDETFSVTKRVTVSFV